MFNRKSRSSDMYDQKKGPVIVLEKNLEELLKGEWLERGFIDRPQLINKHPFYIIIGDELPAQSSNSDEPIRQCSICYNIRVDNKWQRYIAPLSPDDSKACMQILRESFLMELSENCDHTKSEAELEMWLKEEHGVYGLMEKCNWLDIRDDQGHPGITEKLIDLASHYEPAEFCSWILDDKTLASESTMQQSVQQALMAEMKEETTLLLVGLRDRENPQFRLYYNAIPEEELQNTANYFARLAREKGGKFLMGDYETVRKVVSLDIPPFDINIKKLVIRYPASSLYSLPSSNELMMFFKKFPQLERIVIRTCHGIDPDEARQILNKVKPHRFKGSPIQSNYFAPLDALDNPANKQEFLQNHSELQVGDRLVHVTSENDVNIIKYCELIADAGVLSFGPVITTKKQISKKKADEVKTIHEESNNSNSQVLKKLTAEQSKLVLPSKLLEVQPEAPKHKFKGKLAESTQYLRFWDGATTVTTQDFRVEKLARELNDALKKENRSASLKLYVGPYDATRSGVQRKNMSSEYRRTPKALEIEIGIPRTKPDQTLK